MQPITLSPRPFTAWSGSVRTPCRRASRLTVRAGLFDGWGGKSEDAREKERDRQEAFEAQQAVLRRRRQGSWQKEVQERRAEVRRYNNDAEYRKRVNDERRKNEPKVEDPKSGIIIPLAPFGIPKFDNGERFDLRGKYVDTGYVDEDADFFKSIGRLFGGGKGKQAESGKQSGKR